MSTPQQARAIADAMSALWQGEFPATIRVMSAVGDARRDYRPDPKSRSAWDLVTHIATGDRWFLECIERGVFHFDPQVAKEREEGFATVADVVTWYQNEIPGALGRICALPDDQLAVSVSFFGMFEMSRARWIGFANNHSIHHRGQLSAYLRSLGAKVPDIYGPSGDAEPAPAAART